MNHIPPHLLPALFPVYRWSDGYVMVRPLTKEAFHYTRPWRDKWPDDWPGLLAGTVHAYALLDPQGASVNSWTIDSSQSTGRTDVPFNRRDIDPIGPNRALHGDRWRAFFLDMLVPFSVVADGGLSASSYTNNSLPLYTLPWSRGLDTPEFEQLEQAARDYHLRSLQIHGATLKGLRKEVSNDHPVPGWNQGSRDLRLEYSKWHLHGPWPLTLRFDPDPEALRYVRPDYPPFPGDREAPPEWRVQDDHGDPTEGIGNTPLEALQSVPFLVWPEGRSDLGPDQKTWLERYTQQGTPAFDNEPYALLGLPSPARWTHNDFVSWAAEQ